MMERLNSGPERKRIVTQLHDGKSKETFITRLAGSQPFITIFEQTGSQDRCFFGGSQRWFSSPNGVYGGCGTVAAANILAYLALYRENASKPLYPYPDTKHDHFLQHMEAVYRVVKPLPLPCTIQRMTGKIFSSVPHSLGIPGLSFFSRRMVRHATFKGVALKPAWRDKKARPHLNTSLQMSLRQAVSYIRRGLGSGCPVAMINAWNPALKAVHHLIDESAGLTAVNDFQRHWVVITALLEDQPTGRIMIEVSSWGYRVYLNLSLLWGKGYSGLLYFV